MRLSRLLAGLLLTLGGAAATAQTAAEGAVTLYGAYRYGGTFTDATSNDSLRLDNSSAWAASYDRDLDASRQLQFYVSYQHTHLGLDRSTVLNPPSGATPAPLPIRVIYFQIGGTNFFDGPIGRGPYLVGGLGATLFAPGSSGRSGDVRDEVRPSLNLGIGYQVTLSERVALRAETRGYFTLVHSSGGLFCSGGCVLKIKADTVTQGEVQLGLSYRF
jgi:Outer membrane protein beta-barrel domain